VVRRRVFAAHTRMKIAGWLDVVAWPGLDWGLPAVTWKSKLRIGIRDFVDTLRRIENDRYGLARLSKIAHMQRLGVRHMCRGRTNSQEPG
jgi:hypothetical protein